MIYCDDVKLDKVKLMGDSFELFYHILRKIFCIKNKEYNSSNARELITEY